MDNFPIDIFAQIQKSLSGGLDESNIPDFLKNDIHDLSDFSRIYYQDIKKLEEEVVSNTVRVEYATGGLSFHRGYYNPSPIDKYLIKNQNQGKLCKSKPRNGYCYRFNEQGQIISAIKYSKGVALDVEYLIMENDAEYGIVFLLVGDPYIERAVKTVFTDGKAVRFASLLMPLNIELNTIMHQKYYYTDGKLTSAAVINGMYPGIWRTQNYQFDNNG